MVEFALLNVVLVPLLLYAIFLMDAPYMKLELQESVVAGVWDFSTRNSETLKNNQLGGSHSFNNQEEQWPVQGSIQMVYSDHTSAYDDGAEPGGPNYDSADHIKSSGSDHQKHHTGFGAQFAYRFEGGPDTQFACTITDQDLSWTPEPSFRAYAGSRYVIGGQATCEARAWIYNYVMPQEVMQEFSKVEVSSLKMRTGDAHAHQDEGGNVANIEAYETAAISFNTWALRNGAEDGDIDNADIGKPNMFGLPGFGGLGDNPFYQRVRHMYGLNGAFVATYSLISLRALDFFNKAQSEKLLFAPMVPIPGPNPPVLPNIAGAYLTARYKPNEAGVRQKPPGFMAGLMHKGFLSTPYDGPNNKYKQTRDARGKYYMGCTSQENPSCF